MKYIRYNNTIISLENIKKVETHCSGSGCKSNPYIYSVTVEYKDAEDAHILLESGSTEKDLNNLINRIEQVLESEV